MSLKTLKWIAAITLLMSVHSVFAQHEHDDAHEHDAQSQTQVAKDGEPINAMCPVTTDEEIDPMFTIEYQGQTIGFCCKKCRTRFDKDPEAYLAELPMLQNAALVTQPESSTHDETEPDEHAHEHQDGADDHDETEPHDHATGHGQSKSGLAKLISWLGKFHPPTTHIPIGMLIGAALGEGLYILTKRDFFGNAGTFCVVVAAFGAIGAVTLGWFNGGFALVDDEWVQTVHRWLGTSTALATLLTSAMLIRCSQPGAKPNARLWYRISLFTAAGLVGATGFFGGALVYGLNHYAW